MLGPGPESPWNWAWKPRARSFYVKQAEQRRWSVRHLELHFQQQLYEQTRGEAGTDLPQLPRGRLYGYRVLATVAGPRLGMGFRLRA